MLTGIDVTLACRSRDCFFSPAAGPTVDVGNQSA
jgi:hypothetical protein